MAMIGLYVTEAERDEIKRQAGDVPISRWLKRRLFERMTFPVPESSEVKQSEETHER